jgi:DNA-binding transcriptional regulator/RsmH inhibitor MraZ
VILPRKFRDELGQDMVITKGVGKERCLYVFPQAEFEAFAAKLHSQPLTAQPGTSPACSWPGPALRPPTPRAGW